MTNGSRLECVILQKRDGKVEGETGLPREEVLTSAAVMRLKRQLSSRKTRGSGQVDIIVC